MANITQERMNELMAIYDRLKVRINEIDRKYNLNYTEPKIDLPESLNLQKMTYTPKSESELKSLAEQHVAATVLSKQRSIDSSYSTKLKTLGRKRTELGREQTSKLKTIDSDYTDALINLDRKLTNNGLLFSTTASNYRMAVSSEYSNKKSACNTKYLEDLKAVDLEESDLEAVYNTQCEQLNAEWKALVNKRYQALLESEKKAKEKVEKYNNNVDEKEQRYQFTRSKFIESMRRAERDRVLTMTKLYAQLGDVTYRDRMIREKYAAAQDSFWPLRRHEANALVTFDSFLSYHLEKYYSTFLNWIKTALLLEN